METRASFITTMQETQHLSPEKGQSPANGNMEQFDSDEGSSIEDADFNWDEFLEETGASAAPHTSFKHVEISLQSSFQPGMKLEVANKSNPDTYWVATIITTCGQLLLLRYCGYGDDRRADFWCDVMTADLHPVGWCTQNNKVLMPPDDCRFTAEPTEPNLSWHYLNAFWDALKTLDDKIIVYTCNCRGGSALMLLTDGNSNRAFLCADPHSELESACCVNQEMEESGDVKEYSREKSRWTGTDEVYATGMLREKVPCINHFFSGYSFVLNNVKVINLLETMQNQCCKRRLERFQATIKEKYVDWTEFLIHDLTGARTAPANLLEGPLRGKNPVDLITVDSLIELQDSQNPFQYWIVSVVENVGGRLRLRYVGLEETESYDQWLFYLDCRLRPVGWCQENKYRMDPPADIYSLKTISEWKCALEKSLNDAANFPLPMEVFKANQSRRCVGGDLCPNAICSGPSHTEKVYLDLDRLLCDVAVSMDHADLRNHFFTVGMKLEAVNMREPFHICPASVTKVFNNHYLQVTIDDLRPEPSKISMLCHADSLGILPIQWCLKNGVNLTPPKGYSGQDFDWADYQKQCGAEAAPHLCFRNTSFSRGFTKNMKLEAVNPRNPAEICVASITSVKGRLMWLHLEGLQMPSPEYIVDVESMDIFPVGWCEANAYNLTPPHKAVLRRKRRIAVVQPEKQLPSTVPVEKIPHDLCPVPQPDTTGTINGRYCCPQLYINHRCFSGPYLNKGRIAELPQSVGPGKCVLVLKEVLSMVINAAYKPGSVLRELQLVEDPQWNFQEETLKAKYRGKTYRATVKIVRTSDQVADFCRRVCAKLECCPNLFSPVLVAEVCPENCSIHTKTKYTYYYGKRKKIIKPPIGENNNMKSGHVKPARRRKRRKSIFVQKKRRSSAADLNAAGSAEESEDDEPDAMEDETGSEETSSELRDDQTDTSSAEVPSTRPRRAVTLRSSTESDRPPPTERARRSRRPQPHSYSEVEKCMQVKEEIKQEEEEKLILDSNPLEWTVTDVVRFIKLTDCAPLAKIFQEQDIDGQALLLLTLPTVQECMELKLGPAIKLCHQIERVKVAFYAQYAN